MDRLFWIIVFLFSIWIAVQSNAYPAREALVPRLAGTTAVVLSGLVIVLDVVRLVRPAPPAGGVEPAGVEPAGVEPAEADLAGAGQATATGEVAATAAFPWFATLAAAAVYVGLILAIGFYVATGIFLVALPLLMGYPRSRWRVVTVYAVVTVLVFLLTFWYGFTLLLPEGWLGF